MRENRCNFDLREPGPKAILDGTGLTVLLVDDEPAILSLVARVLRRQGYQVLEAINGVEALEVAARHQGPIHLLLTDWHMPLLDGGGLCRDLLANHPETAVMIMSSDFTAWIPDSVTILYKPFALSELIDKVRQALAFHSRSGQKNANRGHL